MSKLTEQLERLHDGNGDAGSTFKVQFSVHSTRSGVPRGQTHWLEISPRTLALIELAMLAEENG